MCAVSAVGDNYQIDFPNRYPNWAQPGNIAQPLNVTRLEFETLRLEVESLKTLLLAAKKFDEDTGQKDCEVDEKVAMIKKIAELVGVNMDEVFK
jgi:hypothetical protein